MNDPLPTVAQALEANARGEASLELLFRTLVSHRGWIASTLQLKEYLNWVTVEPVQWQSTDIRLPANMLWLFADEDEVQKAVQKQAQLGPCVGNLYGAELFARFPADLGVVVINPGAEPPLAFSIEKKYFPMARGWGESVRFERLLETASSLSHAEQYELLRNAPPLIGFLDSGTHALVTLPGAGGLTNPAAVFTAPDTMARFLQSLEAEQLARLKLHPLKGDWLERVPTQGMDGLAVNLCGGGPIFVFRFAEN